jgi:hypothetical protein
MANLPLNGCHLPQVHTPSLPELLDSGIWNFIFSQSELMESSGNLEAESYAQEIILSPDPCPI